MAAATLHAIDYLDQPQKHPPRPAIAVSGDERFLKRLVIETLRREALGEDNDFSQTVFSGDTAALRDVLDELDTVSLFGPGGRFIVVEDADDFVSRYRAELEDYVAKPAKASTLLLDVKSWPSNTRLAKAIAASGLTIEATAPTAAKLRKWLAAWSQKRHGKQLAGDALDLLLEIVGPQPGLLDQELAKLSAAIGDAPAIDVRQVEELVGGWRAKTTWEMLDAALAGDAPTALVELDRLLIGGENPIGLLGQVGSTLRRLAAATRLVEEAEQAGRRASLRAALEEVGVRPFVVAKSESQLRQLGRQRAGKLCQWLLDADLALKGDSQLPARTVLEQLVVRMARQPQGAK